MSGSTIQFTLALFIPIHQSIQRIMLAAPRPKPLPKPEEVLLVDRVQHRRDRALDELVSPPSFPPKPPDPWSLQLHHNFHHVDGRDPGGFQRDFPRPHESGATRRGRGQATGTGFTDEARSAGKAASRAFRRSAARATGTSRPALRWAYLFGAGRPERRVGAAAIIRGQHRRHPWLPKHVADRGTKAVAAVADGPGLIPRASPDPT